MKNLIALVLFCMVTTLSMAQMSKADCESILSGYSKEGSTSVTLSTKDGDIKREFVMSYVTSFKFVFKESCLGIVYTNAQSTTEVYYTYIPYSEIRYINSQKSTGYLDIVMKD